MYRKGSPERGASGVAYRARGILPASNDPAWCRNRSYCALSTMGEMIGHLQALVKSSGRAMMVTSGNHSNIVMRSAEHTSELQSLLRTSYAVFGLNKQIRRPHSA